MNLPSSDAPQAEIDSIEQQKDAQAFAQALVDNRGLESLWAIARRSLTEQIWSVLTPLVGDMPSVGDFVWRPYCNDPE
jgi:hypothetical protein